MSVLNFGEEWTKKLSLTMQTKTITIVLDELFRKGMPCLVAIEAVSNYILFEKFTGDRKAITWNKELDESTEDFPIKIEGMTSDLCGTLRSIAKERKVAHSPDLFHGLYEISKATSAALSSQEKAAKREAQEMEEKIKNNKRREPFAKVFAISSENLRKIFFIIIKIQNYDVLLRFKTIFT